VRRIATMTDEFDEIVRSNWAEPEREHLERLHAAELAARSLRRRYARAEQELEDRKRAERDDDTRGDA
jgi:hypothetical protein